MTVQWLGHACFKITHNNYSVLIDPYNYKYTEGYPELHVSADKLLISHEHYGHNCREAVSLSGKSEIENPFEITVLEVDHDSVGGIMRHKCLVHILEADGIKVAHMSDIGTQLNGGEISKLFGADAIIATAGSLTGLPSQEIRRLYDETCATVLIPMHYRDGNRGARRLETIDNLTGFFETPDFAQYYDSDTIEIISDAEPRIAVLKYMGGTGKSQFAQYKKPASSLFI